MKLSQLFSKFSYMPPERAVYAQIVAKARQPWLYLHAGVPDTVTGRFDMITLHSFFVMEHLGGKGKKESKFNQVLFDEVFLDMDHSLREMGVGDLSVGKKVRKMSAIFYGACNGYRSALAEPKEDREKALGEAFKRNVLGKKIEPEKCNNLVGYAFETKKQVEAISVRALLAGKFNWPDLPRGN
ncbi:Ubiquinol-cytochrome C chaperone [hydrothermal vent metagenome]|uniref:Ubiquinol-cytochrome C chaperone n=1 Tax=hydrothermal vent metagenome TaxID=652676 RepID=A0A3B0RF11_9ZZZZ